MLITLSSGFAERDACAQVERAPQEGSNRSILPDADRPNGGVTLEDTDVTSRAESVWIRLERFENRIETSAYVGGELGKLLLGPALEPDLEWSQAQSSPNVFRTALQPRPRDWPE